MKKLLLMLVLYSFAVQITIAQKKTSISGIIENALDTTTNIELVIFDGQFAKTELQKIQLETNNGKFKFDFELKRRARAGITINNRLVFLPGSFDVIVNPGDNFTITIPDVNKLGLQNISFSGKGSDKLKLLKAINEKRLATGIHRLFWDRTSISDKYINVDRYLDIIDSMSRVSKLKDPLDLQFIKAQQFDGSMDLILDHSVRNYSDSVAILFEKYIKRKNRIAPFLNKDIINYYGGKHILTNYILLSNHDKIQEESYISRFTQPVEFSELVVKEFGKVPDVKDFLLSYIARDFFRTKWDSPISKDLHNFYIQHVDKKNPYFKEVDDTFEYAQTNLKKGDPFYSFNLPDTSGRRHQLTDFKGKIVLLDFWFNGCFACKGITPSIEKAEDYFKNKDVQFISIGIDEEKTWKEGIGVFSSKNSLQLYTEEKRAEHDIIKFSKVFFYPRLIVLDKQGNIVGIPPNPAADFEGFKAYINDLL